MKHLLCVPALVGLCILDVPGYGQTTVDLRTQTKNVDFSGAQSTRPVKTGTTLPSNCLVGELFFKSDSAAGKNMHTCAPANIWSPVASSTDAAAPANYAQTFSNQLSVSLAHNLETSAVTVQCFDDSIPPVVLEPNRISVTDADHVGVTFVVPQAGTCVVNGSGGSGSSGEPEELVTGPGLLSSGGILRVNPAAVRTYLTGSGSFSFGTITANGGCSSRAIPVTGAVIGDRVALGTPTELLTYSLALTYAVSAVNTVTVRLCNYTTAAITPPAWTWNVDVLKSF
jgi:hypothetical protein